MKFLSPMTARRISLFVITCVAAYLAYQVSRPNLNYKVGQPIDSLNGVIVYFNGPVDNNSGRTSVDNYNVGIKYQCVEFVKRYYYQHLHHKMPDPFGNAEDFFDKNLADAQLNKKRDLIQYKNGSKAKPKVEDLLVFSDSFFNEYGHVAIISSVGDDEIEIVQQNPGRFGNSRETITLSKRDNRWTLNNQRVLGWLRKKM